MSKNIETARWDALIQLSEAVQTYNRVVELGHPDKARELVHWLEEKEAQYVAFYQHQHSLASEEFHGRIGEA